MAAGLSCSALACCAGVSAERMALRAMLCGHKGAHAAFAKEAGADFWRVFDGPGPAVVGDWPAVLAQCRVRRLQPLALLFDAAW